MIISGNVIRALRQLKGVKQETIAKQLGISQPAFSLIEKSDYVDSERFEKIISILGYSKTELKEIITHFIFRK